jgi:hypothetical protein
LLCVIPEASHGTITRIEDLRLEWSAIRLFEIHNAETKPRIAWRYRCAEFFSAIEILETDLWQQYNGLGGIQDSEVPSGSGNPIYTALLHQIGLLIDDCPARYSAIAAAATWQFCA